MKSSLASTKRTSITPVRTTLRVNRWQIHLTLFANINILSVGREAFHTSIYMFGTPYALDPDRTESTMKCPPSNICDAGPLGPSLADLCNASQYVVFLTLLNELLRSENKISGTCERVKPINVPDKEYDFVVIGGGGAGAVVAGRLSEIPEWKVLVLEAGPDEPIELQVPILIVPFLESRLDWKYTSKNESHACLANGGICSITGGKMLGGGTAHNGMVYLRGNPTDYDNWAALGNVGWTWEEVKPFYLKAEDNGEIEEFGSLYHSTGGPLSVERFPYVPPIGNDILKASEEAGYGVSNDLNGEKLTGFAITQATNKKGVRRSSASAYLRPARNRKNLHVSLESHVTRIIVENNIAVGVEYLKNGKLNEVRVSKEVVLSAGSIESPHVLLLSGIGPRKQLESVGVEVVKDLPGVGENLHDHVAHSLNFTINAPDYFDNDIAIATEYLKTRTGPLASHGLTQVVGKLKTAAASPDHPDLQVYFAGYVSICAPGEIGALRSTGPRQLSIKATNLRTKSRGRISLVSKDPRVYPDIWLNYLSDPRDVDGLVQGIKLGLRLRDTEAMRAHNFTLTSRPEKACSNFTFLTDEYWACAVKQSQVAEVHLAGSCKMGNASDPMAVVDPQLRVYGIKGLRVADTSIMPQVTSGNTGAPAMMIGERAADFIKKDFGFQFEEMKQIIEPRFF